MPFDLPFDIDPDLQEQIGRLVRQLPILLLIVYWVLTTVWKATRKAREARERGTTTTQWPSTGTFGGAPSPASAQDDWDDEVPAPSPVQRAGPASRTLPPGAGRVSGFPVARPSSTPSVAELERRKAYRPIEPR